MATPSPERTELLARHAAACDYNDCAIDDAAVEAQLTARNAVASTFGLRGEQYSQAAET